VWFTGKEKAEAEAEAARKGNPAELPTRKRVKRVDGPATDQAGEPGHVEIDLTGLLGGVPHLRRGKSRTAGGRHGRGLRRGHAPDRH